MNGSLGPHRIQRVELATDQPSERVCVQRPLWLSGVTFWTVTRSVRLWSMHHDTFVASLVTGPSASMRARWWSRGQSREVSQGCIQLMEPGETHRTTQVSEPASFFVLWWPSAVLEDAAQELGTSSRVHWREAQLAPSAASHATQRLHDAVNGHADTLEVEHWYVESTARLLEQAAERAPVHRSPGRRHPGVRRAVDYLREYYARSVSLDELARESRLSKFHLVRCFRETTGLAPHQFQKLLRLQSARRLIERGVLVQEAAEQAGFADASHLTRAFKGWLGVSPSHWARASRPGEPG